MFLQYFEGLFRETVCHPPFLSSHFLSLHFGFPISVLENYFRQLLQET